MVEPGLIALLGSGETSSSGRKVFEFLFARRQVPVRVALLETPAGFQPNSALVAGKVGQFLEHSLQNYRPEISLVPARKRGLAGLDPDDPNVVEPLRNADVIFAGAGSPTYASRHLRGTLAHQLLVERQKAGTTLVFASAAAIAVGTWTMPVYEIFKVGDDHPSWVPGLDYFGPLGLDLAIVSHWNNHEGGKDLDTSHCFAGAERFAELATRLPSSTVVLGIDEHTACVFDLVARRVVVMGVGGATILRRKPGQTSESGGFGETVFAAGESFSLDEL